VRNGCYRSLSFALATALFPLLVMADSSRQPTEEINLDRSELTDPADFREGDEENGIAITPWLSLFGEVELEWTRETLTPAGGGKKEQATETAATFKLGFLVQPWSSGKLEVVLEYDTATDQLIADEASIIVESAPWKLRAGKFYTPLGRYWDNFVTGPILDFGETRASGISLGYSADGMPDLSFMLYQGEADDQGSHAEALDWAFSLESHPSENLSLGISYQSDLADSNDRLLYEYGNRFARKVGALSSYILWTTPEFELSLEGLGALNSFSELDSDRDRPMAWNLELMHPLPADLHLAWRLEGSRELEDQPEIQAGLALIWEPTEHASITLEYLHGKFKKGLANDDNDEPYRHVDTISAMLTIGF
jgi:hypothetical protein